MFTGRINNRNIIVPNAGDVGIHGFKLDILIIKKILTVAGK